MVSPACQDCASPVALHIDVSVQADSSAGNSAEQSLLHTVLKAQTSILLAAWPNTLPPEDDTRGGHAI